jgi:hypothetical protein
VSARIRGVVVVLGMVGRMPLAGVAWQALHYLEGLRRLGLEVYYVEDTAEWPYDPERNTISEDCAYAVEFLGRLMSWWGCPENWAYVSATERRVHGLSESKLDRLLRRADALVNLTGATVLREEHLRVPVRIYLETDPVLPQIEVASGNRAAIAWLESHTHHFTYGENIGAADCGVPAGRFAYRATRPPVVLEWWPAQREPAASSPFTTVASWRQTAKDTRWRGETYTWSKHHEFLKFVDLPRLAGRPLELALAVRGCWSEERGQWVARDEEDAAALKLLRERGWRFANALAISKEILPYRDYILSSRGEFTVAKDQNVRLRSGWFSDRSACYLAAGRPVVTQDTGFGKFLPTGSGLFAFTTMSDVLAAFEAIDSDYPRHSRAAREIAEEHFRAEKVLAKLLDEAGVEAPRLRRFPV